MKRFLALLLSALLILSTLTITVSAASVINYNFDNAAENGVMTQAEFATKYGATFMTGSAYTFEQKDGMLLANTVGMGEDAFTLPLDQVFTEGKLEFKSRFKLDCVSAPGGYNYPIIKVSDASGDVVEILRAISSSTFARPQGNSDDHGWVGPTLTTDADGFLNVSIVITNVIPDTITNKTGKNFYVTVHDMNAGGAQKSKHTVKVLDSIASISFGSSKNMASRPNDCKYTFDTLSFKKFVPEVVSVSAPAGSISPKVGTINVAFNTAVDTNTLAEGITFETTDGTPAPELNITPSADKKSVAITFGTLDITDYVLSINSYLKAEEDGAAFTAHTVNYTAVVEPLKILSVSNEGGVVMPSIGTIEISFNNPIEDETLAEGVTFTKEDGTPIPGGASVKLGDTSDKVKVLVGRVGKGRYVLSITDKLKDSYGDTLDEPATTYGYIVEDSNPAMIDVDFSKLADGEYTYAQIEELTGGKFSGTSAFEVEAKNGALEIVEPSGATGSDFRFTNAEPFVTGEISYDFVLKRTDLGNGSGANQFRINVKSTTGAAMIAANIAPALLDRPSGLNAWYSGNQAALTADADGYLNFKVVFTDDIPSGRVTNDSKYIMYIYDNNKAVDTPAFTQIYNKNFLSDITGISFSTYKDTAGKSNNSAISVKSIKGLLNEDKIPNHVMATEAEGITPGIEAIDFVFTNPFKNITADGISILSGDKTVAATFEVNADEKLVKLVPTDYLSYGATYTLGFPAPLQTYEFTTEAYPERVSATTNGMLLDVHLVNNEADEYLIVATYKDPAGNVIGSKSAKTSGTSATINILTGAESVELNAYKVVDGCYIKASLPAQRSL